MSEPQPRNPTGMVGVVVVIAAWVIATAPFLPPPIRQYVGAFDNSAIGPLGYVAALLLAALGILITIRLAQGVVRAVHTEPRFITRAWRLALALIASTPFVVWLGAVAFASLHAFSSRIDIDATDSALIAAWTAYLNGWPKGLIEFYTDVPKPPDESFWESSISMVVATASNLSMGGVLVSLLLPKAVESSEE